MACFHAFSDSFEWEFSWKLLFKNLIPFKFRDLLLLLLVISRKGSFLSPKSRLFHCLWTNSRGKGERTQPEDWNDHPGSRLDFQYGGIYPGVAKKNLCQITRWWFQIFFIFTPKIGEDSHFDLIFFIMGWFNHQLDNHWKDTTTEFLSPSVFFCEFSGKTAAVDWLMLMILRLLVQGAGSPCRTTTGFQKQPVQWNNTALHTGQAELSNSIQDIWGRY